MFMDVEALYDSMAFLYDELYGCSDDLDFYLSVARQVGGPLLELGCGTGRVIGRISQEGLECWGLDISKNMLSIARRRWPNVKFVQGNMADFSLDRSFRLILIPYRSFLHLTAEEKQRCLHSCALHLQPNGQLIIHGYLPSEEEKRFSSLSLIDTTYVKGRRVEWFFKFEEPNKGFYRIKAGDKVFEMTLYFISTKELAKMAEKAGLVVQEVFYFDPPYNQEVVWVVGKN